MKVLKTLLWAAVLLLALFFLIALFLPGEAVHKKEVTIHQPAEKIFQWVMLLEKESMDTAGEKRQTSGILTQVLADARIKIVEVVPEKSIEFIILHDDLGKINSSLEFKDMDQSTRLTQTISLELSYPVQRYIYVLFARKKVDYHLERGLQNVKQMAQMLPAVTEEIKAAEVEIEEMSTHGTQPTITLRDSAKTSELTARVGKTFEKLYAYYDDSPAMLADGPYIFFHKYDPDGYTHYEAVLVLTSELEGNQYIRPGRTYEGKSLVTTYQGSLKYKKAIWKALEEYRKDKHLQEGGTPFGVFRTDPVKVKDPREITLDLYLPVK